MIDKGGWTRFKKKRIKSVKGSVLGRDKRQEIRFLKQDMDRLKCMGHAEGCGYGKREHCWVFTAEPYPGL